MNLLKLRVLEKFNKELHLYLILQFISQKYIFNYLKFYWSLCFIQKNWFPNR